jgi:hypothetical protein
MKIVEPAKHQDNASQCNPVHCDEILSTVLYPESHGDDGDSAACQQLRIMRQPPRQPLVPSVSQAPHRELTHTLSPLRDHTAWYPNSLQCLRRETTLI